MELSDFDLVRGIKSGDQNALDIMVRRWYPRVYGYVLKLVGHEQDAADITQDVFLAVLRSVGSYYPWKKFDSWLFTIAHNKCMDYYRMQKHDIPLEEAELDNLNLPQLLDDVVINSVVLKEALSRLPRVQHETVILYYFQQFTAKEISRMTKTPLPTVKSRLATAKKSLSKYLREDFL